MIRNEKKNTFQNGFLFDGALFVLDNHRNISGNGNQRQQTDNDEKEATMVNDDVIVVVVVDGVGWDLFRGQTIGKFHHGFVVDRWLNRFLFGGNLSLN